MIIQKYCNFLLLFFNTIFIFNIYQVYGNDVKQFVDLDSYDDMIADNVIIDDTPNNNITYICDENLKNDCECEDDSVKCVFWFKDANVKPLKQNFEIKSASFKMSNITTLKRNYILPDNEDTVDTLIFYTAGVKFIEDGAFDKFISLKTLWLLDNQLTNIDEKVLTPQLGSTLLYLILTKNKLTTMNLMAFKHMKKLNGLSFTSNTNLELINIFPEMDLTVLNLGYCGIKFLDENVFANLQKMEILLLDGNNLSSVPATIKFLPNLYQIDLEFNLITKIEKNAFASNPKMKSLFLHKNPLLQSIGDCAFCGLPILEWLSLSSCHQLSYIHENAFGAISTGSPQSLKRFDLNECNIKVLPETLIDWKNTKEINIGGNPFACNCSMAWLFNDLHSESSIYDKKIKRRYHGHKYILGCFPPFDTAHKHFLKPLNISDLLEPCKQIYSSSNLFWFFFFAFAFFWLL